MKGLTGKLKERVKRKETLIAGCVMDSRSGAVMEMYQDCGYDMALIDREHTALNSDHPRTNPHRPGAGSSVHGARGGFVLS